jgi:hypothetical protein
MSVIDPEGLRLKLDFRKLIQENKRGQPRNLENAHVATGRYREAHFE